MARPTYTDPLRNFKFQVEIYPSGAGLRSHVGDAIGRLGFTVVSGVSVQHEMIAYREGGMNTHPHKMVGQSDYGPITLSKGTFGHEKGLWAWNTFLHSWSQGGLEGGSSSVDNDYRCDLIVKVFDHPVSAGAYATPGDTENAPTPAGDVKLAYKLYNAWPSSFALNDLNAGDNSILIQQMVIVHEGFDLLFADDPRGSVPASALNIG